MKTGFFISQVNNEIELLKGWMKAYRDIIEEEQEILLQF